IRILSLIFEFVALILMIIGTVGMKYGYVLSQSISSGFDPSSSILNEMKDTPFYDRIMILFFFMIPLCVLLIAHICLNFKKERRSLYSILMVGLLFVALVPPFGETIRFLRFQMVDHTTVIPEIWINLLPALIPLILIGIYLFTDCNYKWLYRVAFSWYLFLVLWGFFANGKEWIEALINHRGSKSNRLGIEEYKTDLYRYGFSAIKNIGEFFFFLTLWLSVPKFEEKMIENTEVEV
ncbi:MAG: hypothetical protein IJ333_01605, partial [Clostridia bacterium]|nr:hypothetical protein [Clostridia bacterium]